MFAESLSSAALLVFVPLIVVVGSLLVSERVYDADYIMGVSLCLTFVFVQACCTKRTA